MLLRCLPVSLSLSALRPPPAASVRSAPSASRTLGAAKKPQNAGVPVLLIFQFLCVLASYIALMEAYAACSHIEGSLTLSIFISQPSKLATP